MTEFEQKLFDAVRAKKWRGEVGLCREFGKCDEDPNVVDALFVLVRNGHLEWFGAENNGSLPLRYRVPPPRPCAARGQSACYATPSHLPAMTGCTGSYPAMAQR
jgi:hypothetical protein